MNDTVDFILSLSIGIAAILGLIRFSKIDKSYYPFIFSTWASLLVEITARLLLMDNKNNTLILFFNIYYLVDFYLFFLLFYNWRLFGHGKKNALLIAGFVLAAWIATTFFINGIQTPNFYFPVLYSFVLVFFSVTAINKFIVNERGNIFMNARFWICLGLIIFYTFFIVTNTSNLSLFSASAGSNVSSYFRRSLHAINVYSNLLVNIMYAIAVLWVPRKKNFTSLF
jgi:hypothetical protein